MVLAMFCFSIAVVGQVNSHYWSNQYGAKGLLLNGAVIGSADDETAIYYNPGAMGMKNNTGISLSFVTPTFSLFRNRKLLGNKSVIDDATVGLAPGLVAGLFKPFKSDKVVLGVTTFTRYYSDIDFKRRLLSDVAGTPEDFFLGEVVYDRRLVEQWFGVGIAYKIHEKFSVGLSQFATFHSEHLEFDFKKEILDRSDSEILHAAWKNRFRYGFSTYGGMLTKIGLNWKPYAIKFGLTLTTNTYYTIRSDANYEYDEQRIYQDEDNVTQSDIVGTNLDAYKTPWSTGFGLEFPFKSMSISISGEYFGRIKEYNVIYDLKDPYEGQSVDGEERLTNIRLSNRRVINFSFGLQKEISRKLDLYYGFRTDISPTTFLDIGNGISFLGTSPDMYHFSLGASYDYGRNHFAVGLDYGFGFKAGGPQLLDSENITYNNIYTLKVDDVSETYAHVTTLFLTYDF